MIDETIVLLIPFEDYSKHRLAKHIATYVGFGYPFKRYYYESLRQLFSRVIVYDYVKRMTEIGVNAVNRDLIELVKTEHPKYVIWVSVFYEFLQSTADRIRQEGSNVIGLFFDDEWRFGEYSKWWIPHLDYCITSAIDVVPEYERFGARIIYTPPWHGTAFDRDWSKIEEKYEVTFVGSKVADREQWINVLKERNIPLSLFGLGWNKWIPFEEMIDIFQTSKINLNFSLTHYRNKPQWKARILDVCLTGGFLLTEYAPGIENFFEIGKEIACFHSPEEMIDKINYYLTHDEERRAIAQAGWERATSEYTPYHLERKVFAVIEKELAAVGHVYRPQALKMPAQMRKRFSEYYMHWGAALSEENYKDFWKDALALSIRFYPFNVKAWYHYIIGFLPYPARMKLIRLYRALFHRLRPVRPRKA